MARRNPKPPRQPKPGTSRRRRRRGDPGPILRVLSVLLAAVAIVSALTLFFKVDQVVVSGNSRYTADEILAVTGVQQGDNLILLDKYGIAKKLYTKLPYITDVQMRRKLPDVLMVEVTETRAAAAVKGAGAWWLIAPSGKILEPCSEEAAQGYARLENMTPVVLAVGERVELSEECPLTGERLLELLGELEERGLLDGVDSIDAGSREILVLYYDGRFRVEMYYDADFAFKLSCLEGTLSQLQPNESGTIRMTMKDDNEVRFIPDYAYGNNG